PLHFYSITESLLARFQQTDSVRFEVFSAIWREMCFSDIFLGITNVAEMRRFCKVALATAVKYFLPPHSYQIRVGGLYLMFALYNTQLTLHPVMIRLALKDWALVQMFVKESVASGHQDVVYIFKRLVATKAIHYTAMPHLLTFQKQRNPKKQPMCAEFLGRTTAVQDFMSAEILEEMNNIQTKYEKMKEETAGVSREATMTHREFTSQLKGCMSEFIKWQQKTFSQDKEGAGADEALPEDQSSSSRAKLLSSIKKKSYCSVQEASKSRRHRQAEVADSSSLEGETLVVTLSVRRRKAPSLRARTEKNLSVTEDKRRQKAWLLSAPQKIDRVPKKRRLQVEPSTP
uniref:snRNA-activating protein complex subunit 1-like n=1 Tax=Echeneis naucrates TaxID=173247 RepID=A0A665VTQ1_ECHNA